MIGLLGDIHFGLKDGNKVLFEEQLSFFEQQFFPFLLQNDIKTVISVGDVFDNRNKIDIYILQELETRFFRWFEENHIQFHVIIGNHDCVWKHTRSHHLFKPLFKEFKFCTYYDEITKVQIGKYNILMVPWLISEDELKIPKGIDIVAGHFETVGFEMVRGAECRKGLDDSVFDSVKMVISGHFHNIQSRTNKKGNVIQYLGSTLQITWNDFSEKKGFWTLGDNFDLTFHENTVNPKFLKVIYSDDGIYVEGE